MADAVPLTTVGLLLDVLNEEIDAGTIKRDTKLALSSDEEGNQIHACWAYGIEQFPQVWKGDDVVPADNAKTYFVLWPSHEEVSE